MKKILYLALGILILGAVGQAWSQGDSAFLDTAASNRLSPRLPNLTVGHLSHRAAGLECPQNVFTLNFFYPQGFGRPGVDEAVAKAVTNEFEAQRDTGDGLFFCDRELCGAASCNLWPVEKTFAVYASSDRHVSVLFTEDSYTGGAHGNLDFEVLNFNLAEDRPLTLVDLFPHPEEAVPKYWNQVYTEWCRTRGVKYPLHFKILEKCRPGEKIVPPDEFQDVAALDLEDLGRLVFTTYGATLLLGPYESGSYASGSQALDLPKDTLLGMGANPDLWAEPGQ